MSITPKSLEFIEGYVFSKIENTIIQSFCDHDKEIHVRAIVPKHWFGLRAVKSIDVTIPEHVISKLRFELKDALSGYNTDGRSYDYSIDIRPEMQYIEFSFHGELVEPVKEMTIADIEKQLGYKIKIIGENI